MIGSARRRALTVNDSAAAASVEVNPSTNDNISVFLPMKQQQQRRRRLSHRSPQQCLPLGHDKILFLSGLVLCTTALLTWGLVLTKRLEFSLPSQQHVKGANETLQQNHATILNSLRNKTSLVLNQNHDHHHAIPNILIFTHAHNLLAYNANTTATNNTPETMELQALANNVQHIITLHPTATVRFLLDTDCVTSIRQATRMMGMSQSQTDFLIQSFLAEPRGMIKADLCRGAALYETGGLYVDVDVGVRRSLWDHLQRATQFATVRVHPASQYFRRAFFQAFWAVTPQHAIVRAYMQLFLEYYQGKLEWITNRQPIGVLLLYKAYEQWLANLQSSKQDIMKRTVELWQEVDYRTLKADMALEQPLAFPTWGGHKRACKMMVLQKPYHPNDPMRVPLYSRIANSRMCQEHTKVK